LLELLSREPLDVAVQDADQGLLEEVGAVEPLVLALQRRQPNRVVVIPNVLPPKCASAAMEADARCYG
jgi:hypothetical protein